MEHSWLRDRPMIARCAILLTVLFAGCRDEGMVGDYPPDAAPGPPCDCESYFPMCVGARWTYDVFTTSGSFDGVKTLEIVRFEERSDDLELADYRGLFVQLRLKGKQEKYAWLVQDGTKLLWLKDEWSDVDGPLTKQAYFRPGKLRIDESHTTHGKTWPEEYDEVITVPDMVTYHHTVAWDASRGEVVVDGWPDTLCQHKVDFSPEAGGHSTNAQYCFVQGVGKVYELTLGEVEEFLTSWTIPGCPRP